MSLKSKILFSLFLLPLFSCSLLGPGEESKNTSRLFHPAMMEGFNLDFSRSSLLTNLESLDQNTGGGGCSACAK